MKIYPSIASADILRVAQEIDRLQDWPWFHFDIEDGNFTPNITFGQKMLRSVSAYIAPRKLDVHLMTSNPMSWLPVLRECGVESVCAHLEALRFPLLFLNSARDMGMKAGLAINISTGLESIAPFINSMDTLLVMTAEPDSRGEELNQHALEKAAKAAATMPIHVMADGNLNQEALAYLSCAGVYGCVLGRLVFRADDPFHAVQTYHEMTKSERGTIE